MPLTVLQVCEYFQDFDPLRSGSITKSQFRRCLSNLGLSAIGQHNLSESQFQMLCGFYEDPAQKDKVLWTRFMDDIESGKLYIPHIEVLAKYSQVPL